MGLILDTSILIDGERRGHSIDDILLRIQPIAGMHGSAVSAITVVEMTHGIYRAKTERASEIRRAFAEKAFSIFEVVPVTLEIAQRAGRIEGEQAALGNIIAFPDLLIGATALHLGFSVVTLNRRHFERIPGLRIDSL